MKTPESRGCSEQFPQQPVRGRPCQNEVARERVWKNAVPGQPVSDRVFTQPRPFADISSCCAARGTRCPPLPERGGATACSGEGVATDSLGPNGLPTDPDDIAGHLAPLFRHGARTFPPRIGGCPALPTPEDPLAESGFESSAAERQSTHPHQRKVERTHRSGPLWRRAGLMADFDAALNNRLPTPTVTDGAANAPGGAFLHCLASLPPQPPPPCPASHRPARSLCARDRQEGPRCMR